MSRLHGRRCDEVLVSGGIVRGARRPPAWQVPGPSIPFPPQDPALLPQANEDLCFLAGHFRILQRLDGHRWSLDDLVTAWAGVTHLRAERVQRTLDLGCGIGTVLLLTAWYFPHARCVGVEAQEVSHRLACRSIRINGVEARVQAFQGDLRVLPPEVAEERFALVTGTPPYIPAGSGVVSTRIQCEPCRFETRGGIEAYCLAAAQVLEPQGIFAVCEGAGQESRVIAAAQVAGLRIVKTVMVIPKAGKGPLFCVYVMCRPAAEAPGCGPGAGALGVECRLVVRDEQDRWTDDFRALRATLGLPGGTDMPSSSVGAPSPTQIIQEPA